MSKISQSAGFTGGIAFTAALAIVIARAQMDPQSSYRFILTVPYLVPALLCISGLCLFLVLREQELFQLWFQAVITFLVPPVSRALAHPGEGEQSSVPHLRPTEKPQIKFLKLEELKRGDSADRSYPDRFSAVLVNNRDIDVEVSMPIWESKDVHVQIPLPPSLQLEAQFGWRKDDWESRLKRCLAVKPQQAFKITVDSRVADGDGIDIRLKRGTIGCLVFPIRAGNKLYQERIEI